MEPSLLYKERNKNGRNNNYTITTLSTRKFKYYKLQHLAYNEFTF